MYKPLILPSTTVVLANWRFLKCVQVNKYFL